jgi:hypothetical protein
MKLKEDRSFIHLPEYQYSIEIIFTNDIIASRNKDSEFIGSVFYSARPPAALHSTADGQLFSKLYFNYGPGPGIVAHECWHCIYNLFGILGADFENELTAYLLAYLVESVYQFDMRLHQRKKTLKK